VAILTRPFNTRELLNAQELRGAVNPVIALGVTVVLLYWGRVFFITSIIAVIIAFILEPFVGLLMRARLPRSVASFVVCTMALMLLYLIGLGAYTQIAGLWEEVPRFSQRINNIVEGGRTKIDELEARTYKLIVPSRPQPQPAPPPEVQPKQRKRNPEPPPQVLPPGFLGNIP